MNANIDNEIQVDKLIEECRLDTLNGRPQSDQNKTRIAEFFNILSSNLSIRYIAKVILQTGRSNRITYDSVADHAWDDETPQIILKPGPIPCHSSVGGIKFCTELCRIFATFASYGAGTKSEESLSVLGLSFLEVVMRAQEGCPVAKLIVSTMIQRKSGVSTRSQLQYWTENGTEKVYLRFQPVYNAVYIYLHHPTRVHGRYEFCGIINVCAVPGSRPAQFIQRLPVNTNLNSISIMHMLRNTIDECLYSPEHVHCRMGTDEEKPLLPSRVLDVGLLNDDDTALKLVMLPGQRAEYAALSYCWGGKQDFETRSDTLDLNLKSIAYDLLPLTIQDAVRFTRALRIQYLWVDSLCILQDSQEDKDEELRKMADIYNKSTVTICPAAATSSRDGFLGQSQTGVHNSLTIALPLMLSHDKTSKTEVVYLQPGIGDGPKSQSDKRIWPTDRRAWTFQEKFLSPRIITIFDVGYQWECLRCSFNEEDVACNGKWIDGRRLDLLQTLFPKSKTLDSHQKQTLFENWHLNVVSDYSARSLSFQEDKLPAISAVAQVFQKALNDEYIAGIWLSRIREGLSWCCRPNFQIQQRPPGPSWSWASVPTPVQMTPLKYGEGEAKIQFELVGHDIEFVNPAMPLGTVRHAKLRIRAPLRRLSSAVLRKFLLPSLSHLCCGCEPSPRTEGAGWIFADNITYDQNWFVQQQCIFSLKLSSHDYGHTACDSFMFSEAGLLLRLVDGHNSDDEKQLMRIGYYRIWSEGYLVDHSFESNLQLVKQWADSDDSQLHLFTLI
ncbi:heterokaryon incompatibility protein-domain-containing protein [Xylaria bambusicola]|uniref:heterokaryon incompatibility protein-domain-containing protein n=1 Tax=Xylaria bambusicola TaxID=326684 RepID=UPI002007E8B1|nr:heterokaryon incompatibility protein-domain-containing protein [Xylaria bambusicola]KAI0502941.1 heterokaryon incompatibility protein-domain-containing protein [Xylaria bambusicola]